MTKVKSEFEIGAMLAHFQLNPPYPELFAEAMAHSTFANENGVPSNERLEFLGDSVLGLIVCDFLFREFPDYDEGELTKLKTVIVSAPFLAVYAKNLQLDRFIRLGQGELKADGAGKQNILADLCEAFIGAYFLNFGFEKTQSFILPLAREVLPEIIAKDELIHAKCILQRLAQARGLTPEYRVTHEEGSPHEQIFTVEVLLAHQPVGRGAGRSIKEAQKKAAFNGLQALKKV